MSKATRVDVSKLTKPVIIKKGVYELFNLKDLTAHLDKSSRIVDHALIKSKYHSNKKNKNDVVRKLRKIIILANDHNTRNRNRFKKTWDDLE